MWLSPSASRRQFQILHAKFMLHKIFQWILYQEFDLVLHLAVALPPQCLKFLNDFRLRTWHMERKPFAFASRLSLTLKHPRPTHHTTPRASSEQPPTTAAVSKCKPNTGHSALGLKVSVWLRGLASALGFVRFVPQCCMLQLPAGRRFYLRLPFGWSRVMRTFPFLWHRCLCGN